MITPTLTVGSNDLAGFAILLFFILLVVFCLGVACGEAWGENKCLREWHERRDEEAEEQ